MTSPIQVLNSFILDGWSELYHSNDTDVAVTADVITLIEAANLSGVVDDSDNLVCAQIVEDSSRVAVGRRHTTTLRTATCVTEQSTLH